MINYSSFKELFRNSPQAIKLFTASILLFIIAYFLDVYFVSKNPEDFVWLSGGEIDYSLKYYIKLLLSPMNIEGVIVFNGWLGIKMLLTFVGSTLLIISIAKKHEHKVSRLFNKIPRFNKIMENASQDGHLKGFDKFFLDSETSFLHKSFFLVLFPIVLSSVFCAILVQDPSLYSDLVQEDQIIENLSAILYFVALFIFIYVMIGLSRIPNFKDKSYFNFFVIFLACGLFFMGMEEISWFQRVFEVETPEMFEGNIQNEMNLHNFATDMIEVVYYFLAFAFFILIPFISEKTQLFPRSSILTFFTPSRLLVLFSSIMVVYTYDQWNIVFSQISFFVSLLILIIYTKEYSKDSSKGLVMGFITLAFIGTQVFYLLNGDKFVRLWDVTEYKELFIPLAFTLYSIEIAYKTQRLRKFAILKTSEDLVERE